MVSPDVVEYLRENMRKFPLDALRRQLYEEGVSEIDFEHCLAEARRAPTKGATKGTGKGRGSKTAAKLLIAAGGALIAGVGLYGISHRRSPRAPAPAAAPAAGASANQVSSYVSPRGWVVGLPPGYVADASYKDDAKTIEVVHFCKRGTDPTNFLDPGLFGQLDIIRLEVEPSPFPDNPTGLSYLTAEVRRRAVARREKYVLKQIHVATLPGVRLDVQAPFPRVETYILGQKYLYYFYGGQVDDVWRDIVLSLRDVHSEN